MVWVGKGLGWVQPGVRVEKHSIFGGFGIDMLNYHGSQQYTSQHDFGILYFLAFTNVLKFFGLLYYIL